MSWVRRAGTGRRIALTGVFGLGAALAALVAAAPPVGAAGLVVTTAGDVVADDGVCSLREAIEAADSDTASGATTGECAAGSGPDVITFAVAGPFVLGGTELGIDSTVIIDGGSGVTIDAAGTSRVVRVSAGGDVTLESVTITGGDAGAGQGGGILDDGGALTVSSSVIDGNAGDGLTVLFGGTAAISDSIVSNNTGRGIGAGFASVDVSTSTVSGNGGLGIFANAATVTTSEVSGNGDDGIWTSSGSVSDSTVSDNTGDGIVANAGSVSDSIVSGNGGGGVSATSVIGSTVSGNAGVGVSSDLVSDSIVSDNGGAGVTELDVSVVDSTVSGNAGFGVFGLGVTVTGSTISGNDVGVFAAWGGGLVTNSTVTANAGDGIFASGCFGLTCDPSAVLGIEFSTVTDNGGTGILVDIMQADVTAAIVAGNTGEDVSAFSGGAFTSGGYNVVGTGSGVGAFTGPGDVTGVTDPGLGPLADNGGPTMTHLPTAGSAALDRVTAPVGTDPSVDQRGVARPQGAAKDTGAVEREDLWVRPFGAVLYEGDSGTTTADVVVYLEDGNGDPTTSTFDVTVDFATVDVFPNPAVAQAGSDFISTSGTLTIPAGASQATVPVEVIGDTVYEPDLLYGEWGLVAFSNPSPNARLNLGFFGLGLFIIGNDDPPP